MKKLSELRLNLASMCMWEEVKNQPFELSGKMLDVVLLMWCIRKVAGDFAMDIDEYMAYIDEHAEEWKAAMEWLSSQMAGNRQGEDKEAKGKKAKSAKKKA